MIAKISHITLAFLVLIGSTGFTVKKHYCQKKLESISFLPISGCCQSIKHSACRKAADICKKGCCDNQLEYVHLDQDLQTNKLDIPNLEIPQLFLAALPNLVIQSIEKLSLSKFLTYKPPIVEKDISVLFQIFRC